MVEPIRVLYVARAPFISGAERALVSMLRHLDRTRVEPMLVVGCETKLIELVSGLGIEVEVVELAKRSKTGWLKWRRSVKRLKRVMGRFEPDVVHANDVPSCQAMSLAAGKLKVPRVVHIRWGIAAGEMGWWAFRGAEAIVCISQWVREQLGDTSQTAVRGARVEVVPDAVDWPAMEEGRKGGGGAYPTGKGIGQVEKLGVRGVTSGTSGAGAGGGGTSGVVIGFAGQLIESKGLDLVIEAMGRVPMERRPRLMVAGEDTQTGGAYRRRLEELAKRCGVADRVTWLGFLDDVSKLYRAVDAVVCPSRVEPLGLVPLEAARYRLATFANRIGGLAETIEHERTGYLVEPTVTGWAGALERLEQREELAKWGQAAYERTKQVYSPRVYQRRLMGIYRQLMGIEESG